MRRRPRPAVLAALLATGALCTVAAGGCGGGDDLTRGLSPEEILDRSRETAAQVTTYHPRLDLALEVTPSEAPEGGVLNALAGQPVTIVADGPVRRPIAEEGPAFAFDLDVELGDFAVQGKLTKVDDAVYLSFLGADFQLDLPPEQAQAVRIPPEPALFMESPVEVGREELDGIPTVHLQGEVATDAVLDYLLELFAGAPNLLGGQGLPEGEDLEELRATLRDSVQESRSEVWIGTEDLLPHRVAASLVLGGQIGALLPGVTGLDLEARADVGGFDEEVVIEAPANPIPFDPDMFSGLVP
jgi:hypothetical protein